MKNVNKESWQEFKAESARHGMRMGEFLSYLVEEHKKVKHQTSAWDIILSNRKGISDEDAKKMKKATSVFEKDVDFE